MSYRNTDMETKDITGKGWPLTAESGDNHEPPRRNIHRK